VSIYQTPEAYVKQFIEQAVSGVGGVQLYEEMRVPYIRLQADYGIESIVIEAEPPCGRARGREQVRKYMSEFKKTFGIVVDIPIERYYREYPNPCRDRVGFELYVRIGNRIEVVYSREYSIQHGLEHEILSNALNEFRNLIVLLKKLQLFAVVAKVSPSPEVIVSRVNELIAKHYNTLKQLLISTSERVRLYFNTWRKTMELVYGKEVVEKISEDAFRDLFIKLSVYVAWLKSLGATLLEATLGGGKYTIPLRLYLEGHKVAVKLFWFGEALARFNIRYLFERDECDWLFAPDIAPNLNEFFRDIGAFLLSIDWSQEIGLDLLKRVYQNIVPREVRKQLGEFYTPDWIAQIIIWRALHILVKGYAPKEPVVSDPSTEIIELLDEFYRKHNRIPRFIDPTCGSFTFGVHYINSLLKWYVVKKVPIHPVEFARQIMNSVIGIDVNPVAVVTAKVNYLLQIYRLLALHGEFLVDQPIIPILKLDLLALHTSYFKETQRTLDTYFVRSNRELLALRIPLELLGIEVNKEIENSLREKGVNIVKYVVKGDKGKELHYVEIRLPLSVISKAKNAITLFRALVALIDSGVDGFENEVGVGLDMYEKKSLDEFRRAILALSEKGLNSIWHSIAINYAMAMYITRQGFELVLGNLPWVNISKYPTGYAEIVKIIAKELGVSPPPQATRKLDISIPLFAVALRYLASSPSVTALMVPTSVFRGLHGAAWRKLVCSKPYTVVEIWDLEDVKPFEGADNQPGIVFVVKR